MNLFLKQFTTAFKDFNVTSTSMLDSVEADQRSVGT